MKAAGQPDWARRFYRTKAWQRKRIFILQRDQYLCQPCLRWGRLTVATIVHHIKELRTHPELALVDENLESLCHACHEAEHPDRFDNEEKKTHPPEQVRVVKV